MAIAFSDNDLNDLNVLNFLNSDEFYNFLCAKLISSTNVGKYAATSAGVPLRTCSSPRFSAGPTSSGSRTVCP
jgi:hypothetical protein